MLEDSLTNLGRASAGWPRITNSLEFSLRKLRSKSSRHWSRNLQVNPIKTDECAKIQHDTIRDSFDYITQYICTIYLHLLMPTFELPANHGSIKKTHLNVVAPNVQRGIGIIIDWLRKMRGYLCIISYTLNATQQGRIVVQSQSFAEPVHNVLRTHCHLLTVGVAAAGLGRSTTFARHA